MTAASSLVRVLIDAGQSVAVAESLTGGRLCAALIDVPGASAAVAGGITAYSVEAKSTVLGVDPNQITVHGTVSAVTARLMAGAVRERFGTDWAIATTGVAGPHRSEGQPVGRVYIAVAGHQVLEARQLDLAGDRDAIRTATVAASIDFLAVRLGTNRA